MVNVKRKQIHPYFYAYRYVFHESKIYKGL